MLRRYIHQSQKFMQGKWYEVPDTMGDELSVVTSRQYDDDSPLAFDVFDSKAEALGYVAKEAKAKAKATAENPEQVGVLTTKDLNDDDVAKAKREERAKANLERAKAKRAKEKEKESRREAKAAKKDADKVKGGQSPGEATVSSGDAGDDSKPDPFA